MHIAAFYNNKELIRLLLENNADIWSRNIDNKLSVIINFFIII